MTEHTVHIEEVSAPAESVRTTVGARSTGPPAPRKTILETEAVVVTAIWQSNRL